jgi:hypothetical protein
MAEIAIISQDFCTLAELQTQGTNRIEFKSVSPYVAAQYILGPLNSEIVVLNHIYGFIRKVGVVDTKTGGLKISKKLIDRSDDLFPLAELDMDNNRIINVGDADMYNSQTEHHAVNLRVGDIRYLRREANNVAPENERTMYGDVLFDGDREIKKTTASNLTIRGAYDGTAALISLNGATASIKILSKTTNTGTIDFETLLLKGSTATTDWVNTNNFTLKSNYITIDSPETFYTGSIKLNQTRLYNLTSREYNEIVGSAPSFSTAYDYDAINFRDFKRHQRGRNFNTSEGSNAANIYVNTVNGVHQFRRIVGGTNIRVDISGNDVVINNTMPLGLSIIGTNLGSQGVANWVTSVYPPSLFSEGTICRVAVEFPDNVDITGVAVNVTGFRGCAELTYARSISRTYVSGAKWCGSGPDAWAYGGPGYNKGGGVKNQPNFTCNNIQNWVYRINRVGGQLVWVRI